MGGGCSQQLLCFNPSTVMVVLLLGLWLLMGCDNYPNYSYGCFVVVVVVVVGL